MAAYPHLAIQVNPLFIYIFFWMCRKGCFNSVTVDYPHEGHLDLLKGFSLTAPKPIAHHDISDWLRDAIRGGTFKPGDTIPSEAELCVKFDAARGTVRQAVATLRAEGLVSSGQGRRSRVLEQFPSQSFDDNISFSQWCHSSGITPGQKTQFVTRTFAGEELAEDFGIQADDPVVSVFRLRLMDGAPAMVERLNYPLEFGQHVLSFDPDSGSIYQRLIDCGVDIDYAIRTIDAMGATPEDAKLLQVPEGTPLLRVRRRAFTSSGKPIESSDDRYLFDKARFTVTSSRSNPVPMSMVSSPRTQ
ncbi:GntR family transcriptional regulator [Corynebacterium sp. p3-SID1145]|uniref:GntR family transcriptional regulator n=1 Tax=unclassified Corynebacterium TaxID=2624378 RepID=UPI0021A997A0|nr:MULTISPECIES: GntR family transcriptional regulator [unclassified Corynebacterium]MCT1452677.1 GntR family transcriptional regulator [Corynebacterium sp. p3-SID1145]MCT1461579.1 GntR family transcriptional regulator [Corynebacterium sp. p3-SID1140]